MRACVCSCDSSSSVELKVAVKVRQILMLPPVFFVIADIDGMNSVRIRFYGTVTFAL